jgi:hypothetical protein
VRLLSLALVAAAAGCGASQPTVKLDETSAAGHRREATRERMLAEEDYARYQPRASAPMGGAPSPTDAPRLYPIDLYRFNPTERALSDAERHLRHAREHEAAAVALEHYEAAECKELSPQARAACPVLGPIVAIEDLADGVRLRFTDGAPVDALVAQMRSHLAFARARGFTDAGDCPLYMRGVAIAASADGRAVEVRSGDAAVARQIQLRSGLTPLPSR